MPRTFPRTAGTTEHSLQSPPGPAADGSVAVAVAVAVSEHAVPEPLSLAMRDFAHEVRNPIATIAGAADALARSEKRAALAASTAPGSSPGPGQGLSNEQRLRLLDIISSEAERLRRMVTQYLDASTALLVSDRPLTEAPLALLHELLSTCFTKEACARITLAVADEKTELPQLAIDPDHLRQVFLNLLENALSAIAPTDGRITISAQPTPDGVRFSVRDTGGGIPPAHLDRIFTDGFTTGDAARRGLGLGIVRRLLDRSQSRLSLINHYPRGAEFTFHIPSPDPQDS